MQTQWTYRWKDHTWKCERLFKFNQVGPALLFYLELPVWLLVSVVFTAPDYSLIWDNILLLTCLEKIIFLKLYVRWYSFRVLVLPRLVQINDISVHWEFITNADSGPRCLWPPWVGICFLIRPLSWFTCTVNFEKCCLEDSSPFKCSTVAKGILQEKMFEKLWVYFILFMHLYIKGLGKVLK